MRHLNRLGRGRHALCQPGRLAAAAWLLVAAILPAPLAAQPASTATHEPVAGWDDGFFLQSPDGRHRLELGLVTHLDGLFAINDDADALTDEFVVRRLRAGVRGRVADHFEATLSVNFGGGSVTVQDAYIETTFTPALRLRLGRSRSPVGHERGRSILSLPFMERALPTGLAPNRDVGIMILGDVAGDRVSYGAGVVNGAPDGSGVDADDNDAKDLVGRVSAEVAPGLRVALSGSSGNHRGHGSLPAYRTTVFRQPFFQYDAGAVADGRLTRVSPYASYYRGPLGAYAEYVSSSLPVREGDVRERITHHGWQVAASWVLTGENASESGFEPNRPFNLATRQWGAVEVSARYHALAVDNAAMHLGLATPGSSRTAAAWSLALSWHLNAFLQYRVHVERTVFDDLPGAPPPENAVAFRSQLSF
jgi:phosphate-selective porin OprO/OprP